MSSAQVQFDSFNYSINRQTQQRFTRDRNFQNKQALFKNSKPPSTSRETSNIDYYKHKSRASSKNLQKQQHQSSSVSIHQQPKYHQNSSYNNNFSTQGSSNQKKLSKVQINNNLTSHYLDSNNQSTYDMVKQQFRKQKEYLQQQQQARIQVSNSKMKAESEEDDVLYNNNNVSYKNNNNNDDNESYNKENTKDHQKNGIPTPIGKYSQFTTYFMNKQQHYQGKSKTIPTRCANSNGLIRNKKLSLNSTNYMNTQANNITKNATFSIYSDQYEQQQQSNTLNLDNHQALSNIQYQQAGSSTTDSVGQDESAKQSLLEVEEQSAAETVIQDIEIDINLPIEKNFCRNVEHEKYAGKMLNNALNKELESECNAQNFLQRHEINPQMRAKMVDWMIEVMNSYKCSEQCLFLSINIMDRFFKKVQQPQKVGELHLIGVTCMFIANKYEEIYPIKLEVLQQKIAHGKLTKQEIKMKEIEILDALGYTVTGFTLLDVLQLIINEVDVSMYFSGKIKEFWKRICVYMGKMASYDYELLSKFTYRSLAAACIYVSFKILEQIYGELKLITIVQQLKQLLDINNEILIQSSTHLLYLARNFQQLFPQLTNLKKFNVGIFKELEFYEKEFKAQNKKN